MQYSKLENEELNEEFIQKDKMRTQKILCPINISFVAIDSRSEISKNKIITLSPFWEKLLDIQKISPEENLKPFKYPVFFSKIILTVAFFTSSLIPLLFMKMNNFENIEIQSVLYFIFSFSLIVIIFFVLGMFHKIQTTNKSVFYYYLYYKKRMNKMEYKKSILDSVFYFIYLFILLKNCNVIENVVICNTQILVLLLRFFFKIGRNVSINLNIIKYMIVLISGIIFTSLFINKGESNLHHHLLNILASMAGGVFWITNREINSSICFKFRFFLIIFHMIIISYCLSFVFFGMDNFFQFFIGNFFYIFLFAFLLAVSALLKLLLTTLYEEIILSLVFCFESFFIYIIYNIFETLFFNRFENGLEFLKSFFWYFLLKSLFILFFVILCQMMIIIELIKNEVNLEGGKIGFRIAQRDFMKIQHFEMLEKLNLD